ncbi:probable polygalacturonase At3g15720 [Syzygium oleosum]|uniref:probable polygalacturonase At3g15720 n=1 Tax=Syzygium oleosum TaxID=219896 RepID=UPI0024B8BB60|nr:probable polygalacturonase At3g15720 [Syzygium oleosum]
MVAAKRVLRYLKGSIDDMRSTSGYCFTFGSACFSWCSKKQEIVAQSTAEAEFIAATAAVNQALWLKKLMDDLHLEQEEGIEVFVDNQATLAISQNPVFHGKTKHFKVRYYFLREVQKAGEGFVAGIYLVLFAASSTLLSHGIVAAPPSYNVINYGAIGNGVSDDTQAFVKAWGNTCGDSGAQGTPTLVVPGGKKFKLSPVFFKGPCKSSKIFVQIDGTLVAPSSLSGWKGCFADSWLVFRDVANLNVKGSGQVDGQGSLWWGGAKALAFFRCFNLVLSGLQHINSPRNHISISGCDGGTISSLRITAPGTSPNTDGIDIAGTNHLNIHDLNIQTGDDCIAIIGNSSYITITGVSCGPGHGISVGSLGTHGTRDTVEEVHVRNCTFTGSTNGARIKTWQVGSGYAKSIIFDQITLNAVKNPIIINQFYTNAVAEENAVISRRNYEHASGVVVSNVTYSGFQGTSATDQAITLSCSSAGCSDIILDNIKITSSTPGRTVTASCMNAHGSATLTTPPVPCLLR